MTDKKRLWSDWPVWGVVILALLAGYFGAYACFVERLAGFSVGENYSATEYVAGYYAGNDPIDEALDFFFYPAHCVDRVLRKSYWRTVVHSRDDESVQGTSFLDSEKAEPTGDHDAPK